MRLKQYLNESTPSTTFVIKQVAKREKVDPKYIKYVDKDKKLYYFNIMDPKHKKYKSTVSYPIKN